MELPITKSPKVVQYSMGHEGQHALLVAEDGSVFFVGTAKRGEDGDSSLCEWPLKSSQDSRSQRFKTMEYHGPTCIKISVKFAFGAMLSVARMATRVSVSEA